MIFINKNTIFDIKLISKTSCTNQIIEKITKKYLQFGKRCVIIKTTNIEREEITMVSNFAKRSDLVILRRMLYSSVYLEK
ncbi:MAG: hypothetical protein J6D26_02700 [Clostridia bacterium]|nr:hypothetical protein [Clostridia bacterium]